MTEYLSSAYKKGYSPSFYYFVSRNRETYDGEWKNNQKHGAGIYTWLNGNAYSGEWLNDKMHGIGRYSTLSDRPFEGIWSENKFVSLH